jgi:hypothetical protein
MIERLYMIFLKGQQLIVAFMKIVELKYPGNSCESHIDIAFADVYNTTLA